VRKRIAQALRRLADKIDGLSLVWAVGYIKEHPGLTATGMREVLGRSIGYHQGDKMPESASTV
jgi:hypothetical protein